MVSGAAFGISGSRRLRSEARVEGGVCGSPPVMQAPSSWLSAARSPSFPGPAIAGQGELITTLGGTGMAVGPDGQINSPPGLRRQGPVRSEWDRRWFTVSDPVSAPQTGHGPSSPGPPWPRLGAPRQGLSPVLGTRPDREQLSVTSRRAIGVGLSTGIASGRRRRTCGKLAVSPPDRARQSCVAWASRGWLQGHRVDTGPCR